MHTSPAELLAAAAIIIAHPHPEPHWPRIADRLAADAHDRFETQETTDDD